ncbi:MAG: hypothetical protein B7Z75_01445 [Acidocella sp. 20-57-95]|nr:MAG: hypothetical protein B7Z75_01445 [Acidocella sp. 20-57-95]HQT65371.1 hypothetical protein [Acidocella sp.]
MTKSTNILKGLFLLARGRSAGIAEFGNHVNAMTASLAPLIAFPLVGSMLLLVKGDVQTALTSFTAQLCVALAPAVITYEFARLWQRQATWLRTVTALNWSFWLAVPLLLLGGFAGAGLVTAGFSEGAAGMIMIAVLGSYIMWFHWFTVRNGLQIGGWQALGLVLVTNITIAVLALGPDVIDLAMRGQLQTIFSQGLS